MFTNPSDLPAPEDIISTYGSLVSSLCRRMIQDDETARDAAQEVWLEAIKSLPTFQGKSKLSTWLYAIAHRVILNHARNERLYSPSFLKSYFHGETLEVPVEPDFDHNIWVRQMCDKCLTGILHCLDNDTRLTFILRDIAQLSYQEIAGITGQREDIVRQTISRTRQKLRRFLNDECALFNPHGNCRCRMKSHVTGINLPQEYEKLRQTVHRVNLFRESDEVLPKKNYWEIYL